MKIKVKYWKESAIQLLRCLSLEVAILTEIEEEGKIEVFKGLCKSVILLFIAKGFYLDGR